MNQASTSPSPPQQRAHETDDVLVVLGTATTAEATTLARALVNERLVACVNLVPGLTSIYSWKDEVHEDAEVLLVMKTTQATFARLEARYVELHSYEVPELLALPVADGHRDYLAWITATVAGQKVAPRA